MLAKKRKKITSVVTIVVKEGCYNKNSIPLYRGNSNKNFEMPINHVEDLDVYSLPLPMVFPWTSTDKTVNIFLKSKNILFSPVTLRT